MKHYMNKPNKFPTQHLIDFQGKFPKHYQFSFNKHDSVWEIIFQNIYLQLLYVNNRIRPLILIKERLARIGGHEFSESIRNYQ